MCMVSRSHEDDNSIRIDYRKNKIEEFLGEYLYKQVKKITGISVVSSEGLFHILDDYTSKKIERINVVH